MDQLFKVDREGVELNMKLTFIGATETVTGSKILVEHRGYKCMIDCGLYQGPKEIRELNREPLEFASELDAIILTHAHIDHSGYLPRVVRDGFRKSIISTEATYQLCKILLYDAAKLQAEDARYADKTRHSIHFPAEPLYTEEDVDVTLEQFRSYEIQQWHQLSDYLSFRFFRAGHILGSVGVQLQFTTEQKSQIVTFTGDLGNGRSQVIKEPQFISETDYLISESTYGDRKIKPLSKDQLASVVRRIYEREGTLIIPAFSVGRTQEILYILRDLQNSNQIPTQIPIYLDSPMAQKASKVYTHFPDELKVNYQQAVAENFFHPVNFRIAESTDESMLLCMSDQPKIVISASGMLQGGRVLHHLRTKLPYQKNAVLFTGYQAAGTKGSVLKNGISQIRIHHINIDVEAEIIHLDSLSAHADTDDLMNWMKNIKNNPIKTFLVHGEKMAQDVLAYRIRNELQREVIIPQRNQEFNLD